MHWINLEKIAIIVQVLSIFVYKYCDHKIQEIPVWEQPAKSGIVPDLKDYPSNQGLKYPSNEGKCQH